MTDAPRENGAEPARRRGDRPSGALVLIGGACDPLGPALGSFLDLCDARDGGRIVGFTTASGDPMRAARAWTRDFARAGAHNVEIPIVDRRDRAQNARIASMVAEAQGIFLGGGDQVHLVATLGGSRVERAIREAYARGAVIGGTSAGAAALTETILAGGELSAVSRSGDLYMGPGFGLLGFRAVIDTHFAERRRLHRLFVAVAGNPDLLGLGIDENTAMVVRGHLATVHGGGGVTFVDGRQVRFDNADELEVQRGGAGLTLSHLRVGIVGHGYAFNLRERELEILLHERTADEDVVPVVKGAEG